MPTLLALLAFALGGLAFGGAVWYSESTDQAIAQTQQLIDAQAARTALLAEETGRQQTTATAQADATARMATQLAEAEHQTALYLEKQQAAAETGQPLGPNFTHHRQLLGPQGQALYDEMRAAFPAGDYALRVPPRRTLSFDTVFGAYTALLFDDPGLFQFRKSLQADYDSAGGTLRPDLHFQNAELDTARGRFQAAADPVVAEAEALATDLDKVKHIHDHLARGTTYDPGAPRSHETYGAVVDGRAVCDGYAMAFKYFMNRLGIPAACVTGTSQGEDHAWNLVMLDGQYYNVDVTWDDPGTVEVAYDYFLLSDGALAATHTRDALSQRLPACTDTAYHGLYAGGQRPAA